MILLNRIDFLIQLKIPPLNWDDMILQIYLLV